MTAPRQLLPGTTYFITRRCVQRQFLLRPSKVGDQIFGYLLAVAAARYHIEIHAFCVMSNHVHLVLTDLEARLPDFCRFLNSLVGRAMNSVLGRAENLWASRPYSAVALQQPADVVDKVAYVLANPVAAGLVRHGRMWPGLWSAPRRIGGEPYEFARPGRFFRKKGSRSLPEQASLALRVPPGFASAEQFRLEIEAALAVKEEAAAVELTAAGRDFVGVERLLAQSPFKSPPGAVPRGGLNPRIACLDKERRKQALQRLLEFTRAYHQAFDKWRAGVTSVVFPAGTYLMRVLHGATCAAPN